MQTRLSLLCLLLVAVAGHAQIPVSSATVAPQPAPLVTPALDNPSHDALLTWVASLGSGTHRHLSAVSLGTSAQGRVIPAVMAYDPRQSPLNLRRVLILARQHGNEPAGTVALCGLLRELAAGDPRLLRQLRRVCLILVPMVNPDGAEAGQRYSGANTDLNRDWAAGSQPETQAVERLVSLWKPDAVIDLHELAPTDRHGVNTIEAPQANVADVDGGDEARRLQAFIISRLTEGKFPVRPSYWAPGASLGLCHRHFSVGSPRVCLLFESERQAQKTPLARRAAMHRTGVQAVLDWFAGDAPTGLALPVPTNLPTTATPDALGAVADDEGTVVTAPAAQQP